MIEVIVKLAATAVSSFCSYLMDIIIMGVSAVLKWWVEFMQIDKYLLTVISLWQNLLTLSNLCLIVFE